MNTVFYGTSSFNNDISNWDVSNVTTMWSLFKDATSLNGAISKWDVSNVTDMWGVFHGATSSIATSRTGTCQAREI